MTASAKPPQAQTDTKPARVSSPLSERNGHGRARYIMVGGFLGAGKTTAIAKLAARLKSRGLKVGLITNDHGNELVDTATLRMLGFATEEIQGGCFCCRFDALTETANRLTETIQPDVFIAEPAGSCADLVATIADPLRSIHGQRYSIAPLSVVVDPVCAARIFGLEPGEKFSENVAYIYKKQLEEADFVVINKCDTVPPEKIDALRTVLQLRYPAAMIFDVSARTGQGLDEWFDCIMSRDPSNRAAIEFDYSIYGEGEALLGWLNCTIQLSSRKYFDASKVLTELATTVQSLLRQEQAEVAHLKMTLKPHEDLGGIAVINLVRNDYVPELSQELPEPIQSGELLLNLRAEADPEILHSAVNRALLTIMERFPELFARLEHCEHFRPAHPKPAHRFRDIE